MLYRSAIQWWLLLKPKLTVGRLAVSTGVEMGVTPSAEQPKLASGALNLSAVFFHTLSYMAPVGGLVYSVQYPAVQAGTSLGLAYVFATFACLLTALCLKELVRKVRSSGGYFVMHSVALGHFAGFTTSWLWFIYAGLLPASQCLLWGAVTSEFLAIELGIAIPWWVFAVVMATTLTAVTYVGIKQSARLTTILGITEAVVFGALGLILVFKAGSNQPLVTFTPAASPNGMSGVMFAMIFGIFCFMGFEGGLPLAEESHNAKRSLTFTVVASIGFMGLFSCFMVYATIAGWGNYRDGAAFAQEFGAANQPFFTLAHKAFGPIGPTIMLLLITNTVWAGAIAGTNAVTRVYYSLGRAGVFPKALAHADPKHKTPVNAILLAGSIALLLPFVFGMGIGVTPIVAYGLLGVVMTTGAVVIYMMTNVGCFLLYWRKYRDEFHPMHHLIIPVVSTVVFIAPLIAVLRPQWLSLLGLPSLSHEYPISLAPPIVAVWGTIGFVFYLYLSKFKVQVLTNMSEEMAHIELVGEEGNRGRS